MFGLVPSFLKMIPDSSLELEWKLFQRVQFDEGPIPNKYRELIGLAIAAVTKCRYCSLFHTEVAKLNGATDAKIEDTVHFAKSSAGWSTYLNGMQMDYEQFSQKWRGPATMPKTVHDMKEMPKEFIEKARAAIRSVA